MRERCRYAGRRFAAERRISTENEPESVCAYGCDGTRPNTSRRVCVAIPTFRRPASLRALLDGIAAQVVPTACSVDVVVLDNDVQPSAKCAVTEMQAGFPFVLEYVHVSEPGLSTVRNFALEYARGYDFLAMIDDDEYPEPQWLRELLRVQASAQADVAIGPVPHEIPAEAPNWIRSSRFFELPSYPDGMSIAFGYSGNCLLRVRSLQHFGITFDAALNLAGGEDMLFFRELRARGAKLVFAARAVATETVGAERLHASYILRLNFRRGNTLALCDRRLNGSLFGLSRRAIKAFARLSLGSATIVPLTIVRGRTGAVIALCNIAQGLGALAGLAGQVYHAYQRPGPTMLIQRDE